MPPARLGSRTAATCLLSTVLAGAGLIACDSSATPRVVDTYGSVLAPKVLLAPSATPRGWFVSLVENYSRSDRRQQTLYARGDRDLGHADGIIVGEGGEKLDVPQPGSAGKHILNIGQVRQSGRLAHFGAYTVLLWHRETVRTTFVIGRGFSDADIIRAARAAEFHDTTFPESAPTIPASALRAGMQRVAETPLLPRESRDAPESILLVTAHRRHFVRILAYRLDAVARGVDDFLAELPANRPGEPSLERRLGATSVLVRGNARRAVIHALVKSMARQVRGT